MQHKLIAEANPSGDLVSRTLKARDGRIILANEPKLSALIEKNFRLALQNLWFTWIDGAGLRKNVRWSGRADDKPYTLLFNQSGGDSGTEIEYVLFDGLDDSSKILATSETDRCANMVVRTELPVSNNGDDYLTAFAFLRNDRRVESFLIQGRDFGVAEYATLVIRGGAL